MANVGHGVGDPAPVCRDLIGLGLQYLLMPHMIARRFDPWSRSSTDPAIRRNGRAVTVASVRLCDCASKNGRSGALIHRGVVTALNDHAGESLL